MGMTKFLVTISVVFLINYCNCCERRKDQLLTVVAIFRHGDKTPKSEYYEVYPNNPWSNPRLWNNSDLGSVTNRGKMIVYERGKWLRERYSNFLPETYSEKHIYVKSSDSDRVLMSAQLLLAGLFPPKGTDVWNNNLPWQPIPIHSIPNHEDIEVAQRVPCDKFSKLLKKQLSSEMANLDDVKYLSKYTGKDITSLEQAYKLYKLLRIVAENDMVLPVWANNALPLLKKKADLFCKSYSVNADMQRIKAGPFLYSVLTHFEATLNGSKGVPKVLLFAGHSRSISNILGALNSFTEQPPYGAILLFELKKNCNGNPVVDVYYHTNPTGVPTEIVKNMPYPAFQEKVKPIAVDRDSWNKQCRPSFFVL